MVRVAHPMAWAMRLGVARAAYRLRLGWLFGHRVILLEHRGRTTGRAARTALPVGRWETRARHAVVAAAGPGDEWYRNVLAHPLVRASIGRERNVTACAVPRDDGDTRHPRVTIELAPASARVHGLARLPGGRRTRGPAAA